MSPLGKLPVRPDGCQYQLESHVPTAIFHQISLWVIPLGPLPPLLQALPLSHRGTLQARLLLQQGSPTCGLFRNRAAKQKVSGWTRWDYRVDWTLATHFGCPCLPWLPAGTIRLQENKLRAPSDAALWWVELLFHYHNVMIKEIKCTIKVMKPPWNHAPNPSQLPGRWKKCLPQNRLLMPRRLGTAVL